MNFLENLWNSIYNGAIDYAGSLVSGIKNKFIADLTSDVASYIAFSNQLNYATLAKVNSYNKADTISIYHNALVKYEDLNARAKIINPKVETFQTALGKIDFENTTISNVNELVDFLGGTGINYYDTVNLISDVQKWNKDYLNLISYIDSGNPILSMFGNSKSYISYILGAGAIIGAFLFFKKK